MCKVLLEWVLLLLCAAFVSPKEDYRCGAIGRNVWGGSRAKSVEYLIRPLDLAIIQHTATPECFSQDECSARVANIQNFHMNSNQWDDIGISFLIGSNGMVYEGAGWLHVGAHTYHYNRKGYGISFIGNFVDKLPSEQAMRAARDLMECGTRHGHLKPDYKLVVHSQLVATQSPGKRLAQEVQTWPHWVGKYE